MHTDREIVKAIAGGDEKMFEVFFRQHYSQLCNYAFTFLKDKDDVEDAVQSLFVKMWEKKHELNISGSLQAYMFASVRNTCLNMIKHDKVKLNYAELASATHLTVSAKVNDHLLKNELQSQIDNAIAQLPEQCRIIFKMSRYEEMKYAEIADQLNISVKTVENQMGKALRLMRERLKDYLVLFIILGIELF